LAKKERLILPDPSGSTLKNRRAIVMWEGGTEEKNLRSLACGALNGGKKGSSLSSEGGRKVSFLRGGGRSTHFFLRKRRRKEGKKPFSQGGGISLSVKRA